MTPSNHTSNPDRGTPQSGSPPYCVSEAYLDPRFVLPALVFGTLIVALFVYLSYEWYWIAIAIVGAVAVACPLQWKAFVETDDKRVREEGRLFGRKVLAKRLIALGDFEAVVVRHCKTTDDEDWTVGLKHRSGRNIWIRRYLRNDPKHVAPNHAADAFAAALSAKTNLNIQDYSPQKPKQWLCFLFGR